MQRFLKMVLLLWATGPNGKSWKVMRNARISQRLVLIVMGNRPEMKDFEGGEKCQDFSENGFIVIGNRPQ